MRARRLWWTMPAALFALTACGRVPESTEKARGVLGGVNLVLAISVLFVVAAVGLIAAAVAVDRALRTRHALAEAPPEVEEEVEPEEEVVAGIRVGRAAVPRWLYGAYVLIPLFAFAYIFSNVRPPEAAEPTETAAPTGPVEETTIEASQITFSTDSLLLVADTEVTVTFDNEDTGVPHDFTVWPTRADADANQEQIATTGTINGGVSRDVSFETPAAGETLFFNCTIHAASMFGDIEVAAG